MTDQMKYIIIDSEIGGGVQFFGPFNDTATAHTWGANNLIREEWIIAAIETPEFPRTHQEEP